MPQILQMFNGPLTHLLLDKKSFLVVNVTNQKDLEDAVDTIFLSILARYPTEQERAIANAEYEANRAAGLGNIVWALVNTREFLFVQ